jgi:hypothetical protein
MDNLTLKDLKLILTNYKKEHTVSITGLSKDDLIKLINKHDMLNTLNINDENDLVKLQKPKKERKPRKPKPTKEEQAILDANQAKKMLEMKKWVEEQRKLRN